jgi:hypothetical protein
MEWLATRLVCPSLKNEDSQLFMKKKKLYSSSFVWGHGALTISFMRMISQEKIVLLLPLLINHNKR